MKLHFLHCKDVMDKQLLLICALTFVIHMIGTLASHAYRRILGAVRHADAAVAPLEILRAPFCRAVEHFQVLRSVHKLLNAVFKGGLSCLKTSANLPSPANVTGLRQKSGVSVSMTAMNVIATALWTVGVFAALYAGVLDPSVRVTSSTLSSIINGGDAIKMAVFIGTWCRA